MIQIDPLRLPGGFRTGDGRSRRQGKQLELVAFLICNTSAPVT